MKKRITALLLSVVLCLSLIGTAFAAGELAFVAEVDDNGQVTISLEEGSTLDAEAYYACVLTDDGAFVRLFDLEAEVVAELNNGGSFTFDGGAGVTPASKLGMSLATASGEKVETTVTMAAVKYAVTVETVGKGTASADVEEAAEGEKVTITATPETGWKLDSITTAPETEVTDNAFTMPGEDVTVTVTFVEDTPVGVEHTITVKEAAHGVMTASAEKAVKDTKIELTATPDKGYYLSNVTVVITGTEDKVPGADSNGFVMPDADVTVTPTFSRTGGAGGGGGGWGTSTTYYVTVKNAEHGKVTARPTSAVKDQKVTLTVKPDEGYVLDTLTAKDSNSKELTLTKVDDSTYTFLMPARNVTVESAFAAAGEEKKTPSFSDVTDPNYTFYADIMWAAEKGYMNGYSDGTFRPNNNTTRQALWMVLARIDGANPSDMSAARAWAMASNVSDGTNPEGAMSRQQMVTMLYRYAQLKGYTTSGGISIAGYPDTNNVAGYAKDAMSWAIGNGIVKGTNDGLLNPTGTASRAHFAAFLHRFATLAGF